MRGIGSEYLVKEMDIFIPPTTSPREFLYFSFPETKLVTICFTYYFNEFYFPGRSHLEDLSPDLVSLASEREGHVYLLSQIGVFVRMKNSGF